MNTCKFSLFLFAVVALILFDAGNKVWAADVKLGSGDVLRVEPLASGIVRVRLSSTGKFEPTLMERYGIVRTNWTPGEATVHENAGTVTITTTNGSVVVQKKDGQMRVYNASGQVVCENIRPQLSHWSDSGLQAFDKRQNWLANYFKGEDRLTGRGKVIGSPTQVDDPTGAYLHSFDLPTNSFGATFEIKDNERFYGLGTASARRLQLRGYDYRLWTEYHGNFKFNDSKTEWEQTEGPIPLLLSTGGWGIFVNTTWVHYYDVGRYQTNQAFFWGPGGQLDFYILTGSLPELIQHYAAITGKPRLMSEFGYGLTYVGNMMENQYEILNDARLFRQYHIPCDIIGLEPQWMKKFYDDSHDVEWNPDKFYVPEWMGPDSKDRTFIGGLDRIGFKLSLWLVCNDDLTAEAERQAGGRLQTTNVPEGWFNHLEKFVRNGVRCFKMDPEHLIQEHLDRKYANGRTDLENHNLTQILYHKQMCQGYEEFTHRRAMTHYCGAYAGVQHWGATTMGDNGGGPAALAWMLNYAMSGHMNTSCDMDMNKAGIHFGFLQPWSQLNNWAYAYQPWFLGETNEAVFRDYAQLRYRLMPYIYSAAYAGYATSMPMLRPMPLAYPGEPEFENCTTEYMFGDSLLVTAFTKTVKLPPGRWIDYWTGAEYQGPKEMPYVYPENRGGGLFVKAGAIIPCWLPTSFVGEKPVEQIELEVYPDGESHYQLYEDDGDSLDYQSGACAKTFIRCDAGRNLVRLVIEPRQGTYRGMPAHRTYMIHLHMPKPKSITVNGSPIPINYDAATGVFSVPAAEDGKRKQPLNVECAY
jgi:alpha-glucosidase (family GH31 glycosyl hydrolase)